MNSNEKIFSVLRAPRVSEKTARLQAVSYTHLTLPTNREV